jgi:hypothetical protein
VLLVIVLCVALISFRFPAATYSVSSGCDQGEQSSETLETCPSFLSERNVGLVAWQVGGEQERSSVAARNHSPSWNERFVLPVRKGSVQEGAPVLVVFEVGRRCPPCRVHTMPPTHASSGAGRGVDPRQRPLARRVLGGRGAAAERLQGQPCEMLSLARVLTVADAAPVCCR